MTAHVDQGVGGTEVDGKITPEAERVVAGHWMATFHELSQNAKTGTPTVPGTGILKCYRLGKKIPISRSADDSESLP